jgi:hypothetical protein
MAKDTPKLHAVDTSNPPAEAISIAKPGAFNLNQFKSKRGPALAGVQTLLTALPHNSIADALDFVYVHPDESKYWSDELCFVNVPTKGVKRDTLHLIDEDLANTYVAQKKILRFRLALATKPFDVFFLCHVPSTNLDNIWNSSNLTACRQAKTAWVQATSRKAEGAEGYKIDFTRDTDAFPNPNWPQQSLDELIDVTFRGRLIVSEDDPGLKRLIGAKQSLS